MNLENDYLWDKTGEDAEIEQLEKSLQVFRYQESNAPFLPKKVAAAKPKFSLFSLRFALSFAACLALLLGGLVIWQKVFYKQELLQATIYQTPKDFTIEPIKFVPEREFKEVPQIPDLVEKPTQISYREKISSPVTRQTKTKRVKPKVVLTAEEKYAYDQLMLALSITSSKFKEVQDKVNGADETSAVTKSLK
ncbi:MAG: hypothetical protein K1X72_01590 [Pyrinomonadaceae bacterium]|nr:hypothetical protein [Pyrinomonadaceae bacterium]